eukprot:Nk52_evm8s213 gene=Nk52_evmTU8s213
MSVCFLPVSRLAANSSTKVTPGLAIRFVNTSCTTKPLVASLLSSSSSPCLPSHGHEKKGSSNTWRTVGTSGSVFGSQRGFMGTARVAGGNDNDSSSSGGGFSRMDVWKYKANCIKYDIKASVKKCVDSTVGDLGGMLFGGNVSGENSNSHSLKNAAGDSSSCAFMITMEMRRKLLGLGYSGEEINKMKPQTAVDLIVAHENGTSISSSHSSCACSTSSSSSSSSSSQMNSNSTAVRLVEVPADNLEHGDDIYGRNSESTHRTAFF